MCDAGLVLLWCIVLLVPTVRTFLKLHMQKKSQAAGFQAQRWAVRGREGALADLDHDADSQQGAQVAAGGAMHAYFDAYSLRTARLLQASSLSADRVADIMSGGATGGPPPTDSTAAHSVTSRAAVWRPGWDFNCAMQRWHTARNHDACTVLLSVVSCPTTIWSHNIDGEMAYCQHFASLVLLRLRRTQ